MLRQCLKGHRIQLQHSNRTLLGLGGWGNWGGGHGPSSNQPKRPKLPAELKDRTVIGTATLILASKRTKRTRTLLDFLRVAGDNGVVFYPVMKGPYVLQSVYFSKLKIFATVGTGALGLIDAIFVQVL